MTGTRSWLAAAGFLAVAAPGIASATCAVPIATYAGGSYGAEAVTAIGCTLVTSSGGAGVASAAVPLGSNMSASATISSGILTAYSAGGFASASLWDTFTLSGLPAGGGSITALLSLAGSLTGDATATGVVQAGASATFGVTGTTTQSTFFGNGIPDPGSLATALTVTNGEQVTVFSQILADGFAGNVADLGDPPTLTLELPAGVTATSASGVFANYSVLAVPEPGSFCLLLGGLAAVAARRRRTGR